MAFLFAFALVPDTADAASKRIAVLMFKPQNYGTEWVTPDAVRTVVFTGTGSAHAYYDEQSFGKWNLTGAVRSDGDVFGWYTVPYNDTGACVPWTWVKSAQDNAAKEGFVQTNYDAFIYVTAATGCGGAHAFTSGKVVTALSGFTGPMIVHELGHAFGLGHASAWKCKDAAGHTVTISTNCSRVEYGDFPVMGASTKYHMNAYHKGSLGFFADSNKRTVTAGGVYSLYPLEQSTTYVQSLRIPRKYDAYGNVIDYYYLDFRQPYGFDSFDPTSKRVNGVAIHVAPDYSTSTDVRSYLLDATTPASTGFSDAELGVGKTFTDPIRGISVTLVSITGGAAQVLVSFP